jgi:uncharacterized membrane protein
MIRPDRRWSDQDVEETIGRLLQVGVVLASAVVLLGGVLYLAHYGAGRPDYRVFRGEPAEFRSVVGVVRAAADLRRRGLIQLGLLLLIATPIARVVFSAYAFARQRDYLYVAITSLVLTILLVTLLKGTP